MNSTSTINSHLSDLKKEIKIYQCQVYNELNNFLIRDGKGKGKSKGKAEGEGKGKGKGKGKHRVYTS
jgi:hypothetical protein